MLVFFDDIFVYSKSAEEHEHHLNIVLECLLRHQLFANEKKCTFGQRQIEYLGHVISGKGVAADRSKIEVMCNWPKPQNLKELRGFLGLTGYYRRFVSGYAKIAWPLTELLKKDCFGWNASAEAAFCSLKSAMTQAPVLALPNFSQLFVVETDASGHGLGAVLMQSHHPIAYFSQVLPRTARQKSVYELELMAIVFVVQKWRHYLLG